jgi:protein-tyrosine phosphatase
MTDLHVHLLAGLDDGPRTWDDAVAMCRIAAEDGVRQSVALAHQSERWAVTPDQIRTAVKELARWLTEERIPLTVVPAAEVMATPELPDAWDAGRLVSVGDHGKYLLVEMPNRVFVDLRPAVRRLARRGVRVILAHPERHPELLHDPGRVEELIGLGCLVQVSSGSVTDPPTADDRTALRDWFRRGVVHLIGSDGHSPRKRKPLLAAAAALVLEWAGPATAARVSSANGRTILGGGVVDPPAPAPARRWWPLRLIGR